ncbi:MAG: segregation and condensation protein A, partial [Acidobacteria bacterium]
TVAADFLVMAATLIEIKSKMLLPKSPAENQEEPIEEDPRQELVKQLLEYEKFKIAAQMLWERAVVEQSIFRRGKTEYDDDKNSVINVGVFELFEAFRKVLERKSNEDSIELEKEQISLEEVIDKLKKKLNEQGILSFNQISKGCRTKIQLILNFLAILEIVRTENVILIQQRPFDDVLLKKVNIV